MYLEKERELPVIAKTQVLVCGGGPAGVGAAIRAAQLGAKTMVVEMQDCLGGVATAGMMSHWTGWSSSKILHQIQARCEEKGKALGWIDQKGVRDITIDQEIMKIVLNEMALENGIELLLYTMICGAIVEDGEIKGVIVENKSGRGVILADVVIDATGDGDVAAYAGVPYYKGREEDGKMQPCTLMFKVGGVDYSRAVLPPSFETRVETEKGELQSLAKEFLPFPAGHVLLYPQHTPGTVCCNMTNAINVDATDGFSLTKGMLTCRSQIEPIIKFLREYAPGYENCWLMGSASLIGIRETRHFEGLEKLTPDDILKARYFDNWVVRYASFNFDVHNMSGASLDETGVQAKWTQPNAYSIPYGCLLPVNVESLLLSGRNISGTHLAHSNYRVMPIAMALGEAAGAAAALKLKQRLKSLRDVSVKEIQSIVGE